MLLNLVCCTALFWVLSCKGSLIISGTAFRNRTVAVMVTAHAHLLGMWLDLDSLNQPGPGAGYSLGPVHTWHGMHMGMALDIYGHGA